MGTSAGTEVEQAVGVDRVDITAVFYPGHCVNWLLLFGLVYVGRDRAAEVLAGGERHAEWLELVGRDRAAEVLADGERHEASVRIGISPLCLQRSSEFVQGISQEPRDL